MRRNIARGGAWLTVAWLVTNAAGAVNTILLVRSMAHLQYGVFVMAASSIGVVSAVAGFGLSQALVQLAPRAAGGSRAVLRQSLVASVVIAAAVAVLTGSACLALGADGYEPLALPISIMIPIAAAAPLVASLSGFLQSVQQPKRLARAMLLPPLFLSGAVVALCLTTHPAATWVAAARTSSALLMLVLLLVAVSRAFRGGVSEARGEDAVGLRRVVTLGGSLLSGTVVAVLLAQLDVLILGFTRGRGSVAFYGPASQVADNALTMAATIGTFYLPTIARVLARSNLTQAGDLYRWASRWTCAWVAPVVAVMLACPTSLLSLLFGTDYDRMATPLRILAVGVLVNLVFGFNGITLDSLNKLRLIIGRQAVGLVANVAACVALVPLLGADGAAIATSSSLLVINVVSSALLERETGITPVNLKLFGVALGLVPSVGFGLALNGVLMMNAVRIGLVGLLAAIACAGVSYLVSSGPERRAIRSGVGRRLRFLSASARDA